jgi:hypothetical protein
MYTRKTLAAAAMGTSARSNNCNGGGGARGRDATNKHARVACEYGDSRAHANAVHSCMHNTLHSVAGRKHSTAGAASHTQQHEANARENDARTPAPRRCSRNTRARVLQSSCNNHSRANNSTLALRSAVCSKTARKLQLSLRQHTHTTHIQTRANKRANARACSIALNHVPVVRRGHRGHAARGVRHAFAALRLHLIPIGLHFCTIDPLQRK